jgi:hypothetical protein
MVEGNIGREDFSCRHVYEQPSVAPYFSLVVCA